MSRIQIPLDALASRFNIQDRLQSFGSGSGSLSGRFASLRPVSEFLDFKRFSKPANFADMQSRVNYNLSHFSSNYAVVFAMLSVYALLTNWLLLFDIVLVIAGMFIIGRLDGRDLEIGTFRATSSQLYTGLLIVAIPLGLIASPFSTLLWLIGASAHRRGFFRGGGLGGRPRSPEFAPSWGRPSRRRRRRTDGDAAHYGGWGDARVREIDSDEDDDTDTQGVGLARERHARFVSDSLHFTGTDLGDRSRGTFRGAIDDSEEDSDATTGEDTRNDLDGPGDSLTRFTPAAREDALVQLALDRIQRAKAKGRDDVKLSKEELAALERRRKRMEEEAEEERRRKKDKKKQTSGSAIDRKKRSKDQRVAVPLSRLEPISRKKKSSSRSPREDAAGQTLSQLEYAAQADRQVFPPMGYFPPPSASRSRAGTAISQRPPSRAQGERGSSPFLYEYVERPPSSQHHHASELARPRSRQYAPSDAWALTYPPGSGQDGPDPFQFQTAGPRAPYPPTGSGAAAAGRRYVSGPAEARSSARQLGGVAPAAVRSRPGAWHSSSDEETSELDDKSTDDESSSTSDETGNGAKIREPARRREQEIVVEVSPERRSSDKKKSTTSSAPSPSKRKPAASGGGRGRRKRK